MCFHIRKGLQEPIVAEDSISVYKIVSVHLDIINKHIAIKSPYQPYVYAEGDIGDKYGRINIKRQLSRVRRIDRGWPIIISNMIFEGFHAYVNVPEFARYLLTKEGLITEITRGYKDIILTGKVLRGAQLLIDPYSGHVVSDQIKLTGLTFIVEDNKVYLRSLMGVLEEIIDETDQS